MVSDARDAKETELIKIAFLNQGGGLLFRELVLDVASSIGPVSYYTSHDGTIGDNVRLVRMPRHNNRGIMARLSSWVRYCLLASFKSLTEPSKPLLFIVTNPPIAPLLGLLAKKLKGQRYILLFYDMYPEALVKFTQLSERSLIARVWRSLNQLAINHADGVITISPQLAKTLLQYYKDHSTAPEIEIVPTWVDTERIRPIPKEQNWFALQHEQVGKLTVLYSGNLGALHDLTMLSEIAKQLKDYPDIHFLVIGEGAGRQSLEAECRHHKLQNITFLPLQAESIVPFSLPTADIGIVALAEGAEGISMPSKTYYMMAAGAALLGLSHHESDLAAVIQNYKCGVNIAPGNTTGAVQALVKLRNQPAVLQDYREHARLAAEQHFSRAVCVPKMLELIRASL